MARTITVEVPWTLTEIKDGVEVFTDVVVECDLSAGIKGNKYGPPEKCFPDDPPEMEVLRVWVDDDAPEADRKYRGDLIERAEKDDWVYSTACELAQGAWDDLVTERYNEDDLR